MVLDNKINEAMAKNYIQSKNLSNELKILQDMNKQYFTELEKVDKNDLDTRYMYLDLIHKNNIKQQQLRDLLDDKINTLDNLKQGR